MSVYKCPVLLFTIFTAHACNLSVSPTKIRVNSIFYL